MTVCNCKMCVYNRPRDVRQKTCLKGHGALFGSGCKDFVKKEQNNIMPENGKLVGGLETQEVSVMGDNNNVINAVKRLERAGDENSRATQKLFEAARNVADLITETVPSGSDLPRGYYVKKIRTNVGSCKFLCKEIDDGYGYPVTRYIDGMGDYLHGDIHCWIPPQDRDTVLQFAKDIAEGLLDEIAAWLENKIAKANDAANILQNTLDNRK